MTNLVSSTNTGGASASARTDGSRPSSSRASAAVARRDAGELERVGECLAAVAEGALDDAADVGEVARKRDPSERHERRIDVRRRPEDGPRDGVKPGSRGCELDQHRDGAVRLRRRHGEEAIGNLPLHHHAPQVDRRQALEALGRRGAWRCCRAGSQRASSERARGAQGRAGARRPSAGRRSAAPRCRGDEVRAVRRARRRARGRTVGEDLGQHAEARADLERDVVAPRARRAER